MTDWIKVQGSQESKPLEFDTESSPTTVYQRRNIEQITVTNEDGTTGELWEYDERKMTREEYSTTLLEQNRADIDFVAAMTGIEL